MKFKFLSLLLFLILARSESGITQAPVENWPLRVGLVLPLTGPIAEYGVAFKNGVELAQTDSKQISENCSFIIEDSKYDSKTAVGLLNKLYEVDRTSVIYNWGGPTSEALAPLTERKDVALFVWSADPRVSEGRKNVIRFSNSGLDYGGTIARYLEQKGYEKIAIVKTDNQYLEAILNGLMSSGAKLKVEVVDNFQPGDQDFRSTISRIKTRRYDALGVFLLSGQVAQFTKQLRSQSVDLPLFGTDFFESMTEVEQSNGGMLGAVFANNQVSDQFQELYINKFSNDLQINHAANGYDFANFLCKELGSALRGLSASQIVKRVTDTKSFLGEQGQAFFTISEKGDKYFKFPVVVRKIESNKIITEK